MLQYLLTVNRRRKDNLESSTIFDYGAFVYSFDGINFTTLEFVVVLLRLRALMMGHCQN
jgi:hypothetical protein